MPLGASNTRTSHRSSTDLVSVFEAGTYRPTFAAVTPFTGTTGLVATAMRGLDLRRGDFTETASLSSYAPYGPTTLSRWKKHSDSPASTRLQRLGWSYPWATQCSL